MYIHKFVSSLIYLISCSCSLTKVRSGKERENNNILKESRFARVNKPLYIIDNDCWAISCRCHTLPGHSRTVCYNCVF
jgi:hypothetical protein